MPQSPKLRSVEKYKPPYPLNKFPNDFALNLGKEIIYHLASRKTSRLEGSDWEEIFARLVGAAWKPSNVGLDDIVLGQTAWGAKTIKNKKPSSVSKVRLISGRNSLSFSYGVEDVKKLDSNEVGKKILAIYNKRVETVRKNFQHLRTVVLIKSDDLLLLSVFEFETIGYDPELYNWKWNKKGNLEGFIISSGSHSFTWQPHGAQFTIIEDVPEKRLSIRIRKPPSLDRGKVLEAINFDASWVEVVSS